MKPFLKLRADQFSSVPWKICNYWELLLINVCYKRKNLDSPLISMFTFTHFPYWTSFLLLYMPMQILFKLLPLALLLDSDNFHLSHVFWCHFNVSDSQFCVSIPVLYPKHQDQIFKQMGTLTHICPSLSETNHI